LAARYTPQALSFLSIAVGGGFALLPVNLASGGPVSSATLSLFWPWAGLGLGFEPVQGLRLGLEARGGYYFAALDASVPDNSGNNPMFAAKALVSYDLSPRLRLGLGAEYRDFLGLHEGLAASLGLTYRIPAARAAGPRPYPGLKVEKLSLDPVLPILYKYYGDHPVGSITLRNMGKIPLEGLKVTIYVNQYMDNPTASVEIPFLKGGDSVTIGLRALLNDRVLGISEATVVQAVIGIETTVAGEAYADKRVETLRLYDRNALVWDDDRRIAAFVAAKDPSTMRFAKNAVSAVSDPSLSWMDAGLLRAMVLHEALALHGLTYQVDPSTPFTEFHGKASAVDYLQFPNQTLDFKAGDCDDLSILNCALLEALGVETAFITVPGHIYMAFALQGTAEEASRRFQNPADLIIQAGRAWLPIEITSIREGFMKAWSLGAKEWRDNAAKGQAQLYPLHEAWKVYEPVGFSGTASTAALPSEAALSSAFKREAAAYVSGEIGPQEAALKRKLAASPGDPKLGNSLGILYARYGLRDKAEAEFNRVVAKQDYGPALVNLGNLSFQSGDLAKAKAYYLRASKGQSGGSAALLGLARASWELKDYDGAARYFAALKGEDPALAARYLYLGEAPAAATEPGRAADATSRKGAVEWAE
jgi:tetratricopeptide (TPR) repeat protein